MKTDIFLVQAHRHTQQIITCAITDQLLRNLPVPVVFFYRESFDRNALIDSLREVLGDFPFFAGTLKKINHRLYIDCNNQGVFFSVNNEDGTINQMLEQLPNIKKARLVDIINPKKVIAYQSPLMTVKLTYFACGGMALGICWHHAVGDMHTFMQLMKAWSNASNKKAYKLPLIVKERDQYLEDNLEDNKCAPGVRYLNGGELFEMAAYMLFRARQKISLRFYFSENELNNMQQIFAEQADRKLSRNDVLCAHLYSLIAELDNYPQERFLSVAINYRARLKLPDNISGNFIANVNVPHHQGVKPFQLATNIRAALDNFEQEHMNVFATKRYIQKKGGLKHIDRFVSKGIDPLKRTLLVTSWVNFGTYDILFGESEPFFFSAFGEYPFPWLSSITEGFSNNGLIYSVLLPSKLAKHLIQDDNLRKIHRYRDHNEGLAELVGKLDWLL